MAQIIVFLAVVFVALSSWSNSHKKMVIRKVGSVAGGAKERYRDILERSIHMSMMVQLMDLSEKQSSSKQEPIGVTSEVPEFKRASKPGPYWEVIEHSILATAYAHMISMKVNLKENGKPFKPTSRRNKSRTRMRTRKTLRPYETLTPDERRSVWETWKQNNHLLFNNA